MLLCLLERLLIADTTFISSNVLFRNSITHAHVNMSFAVKVAILKRFLILFQ